MEQYVLSLWLTSLLGLYLHGMACTEHKCQKKSKFLHPINLCLYLIYIKNANIDINTQKSKSKPLI